ncbi:hypothetical protein AUC45_10985 [Erythrobacter sp. YT30]|nr:hypothetical protein AUC45_10985 [Erythrobacter sp. YT30]
MCARIRGHILGAVPYAESSAAGHLRAAGRPCDSRPRTDHPILFDFHASSKSTISQARPRARSGSAGEDSPEDV